MICFVAYSKSCVVLNHFATRVSVLVLKMKGTKVLTLGAVGVYTPVFSRYFTGYLHHDIIG